MDTINTLSGGYKKDSPKIRSENSLPPFVDNTIKKIDSWELTNNIKLWYSEGRLTFDDIQYIRGELNLI